MVTLCRQSDSRSACNAPGIVPCSSLSLQHDMPSVLLVLCLRGRETIAAQQARAPADSHCKQLNSRRHSAALTGSL